jgi:FdhD protein
MKISADEVFALVNEFQHGSKVYLATHGVHSAALCDKKSILIFNEDIGRHNAIDKIFGRCLLEDIPTEGHMIITSGRISSEILHKVAKRGIPIIISISTPTNQGVRIADNLGITLIGSVRGKKLNVYTNDWRVS